MVQLISGANDETLHLAGMTVGQVRERFAVAFTIDPDAPAAVNRVFVEDEYVLEDGDKVAFTKQTASKG